MLNKSWMIMVVLSLMSLSQIAFADATTQPTIKPVSLFTRFLKDQLQLQTSIVSYRNPSGVQVDLVGAVHVADPSYYKTLNERFTHYDAVLYEMVKSDKHEMPSPEEAKKDKPHGWVGLLQTSMKDLLALSYQLNEIDYTKKNFVHADLTAEQFTQMQDERGESIIGTMFKGMLREAIMGGGSEDSEQVGLKLLAALKAPDRARQLKIVLGAQLASMDGFIEAQEGKNGSVLLTERNKAAIRVMNDQIKVGTKKMAIFYGAAHLEGMSGMLEAQGFKRIGNPNWLTAWDMSAATTQPSTTQPVMK